MPSDFLQQLLARRDTWRGRDPDAATRTGRPTGFHTLDGVLEQGGWPDSGLVELLCALPCPPLMHLLLPLLAGDDGARVIANPPARPSAQTLARAGVRLERLLVLQSRERAPLLRACLEAVASDSVGVMVLWAPGGALPAGTLRRFHLGAQQGRCLLILVRPRRAGAQPSPAPLRLDVACTVPGELTIGVHKQPGGRPGGQCQVVVLPEHLRRAPPDCATLPALTRRPVTDWSPSPLPPPPAPLPLSELHP